MSATPTGATGSFEERAELEVVLNSGIFNRAPNLASFLNYVCERHFEGQADGIKEYSIAVEALRRSAEFDQRTNSIVRVEAHRLRKRLAEYYAGIGADHPIHIDIPNGQYAPRFLVKDRAPKDEDDPTRVPVETLNTNVDQVATELLPSAIAKSEQLRRDPWHWRTWALVIAIASAVAVLIAVPMQKAASTKAGEVWQGSYSEPVANEFRFLAGYRGALFTDRQGRVWHPDAYFEGGTSVPIARDHIIEGLPDPKFLRSRREGNFRYAIPTRQGTYEVHLHFIVLAPDDPDFVSAPLFQVVVNGKAVLDTFDPLSESGGFDRFHSRVIRDVSPASDGKIHLAFQPITGAAYISAVEVLSSEPGRVRPVRIVTAKSSVVDSNGLVWAADEDAIGGYVVERRDSVRDPKLRMLFVSERYGNFRYRIPVPPGRYRVKLYFAETYFGSKLPSAGPALGSRVFNVFANGTTLLREFDVTKEAGGPNQPVVREFENIEPNAQGNIALEFVPLRNYAEVNALEVSQMN